MIFFRATSRAEAPIAPAAWLSARRGPDLILLFCLSWLATLLPLIPHRVPSLWLWGATSAACVVTTTWLICRLTGRRSAIWSLLGCGAVISIASLCDFWRLPPAYLLSQCRTPGDAALPSRILSHIELHIQWFPITNAAMLLWICLSFHAVGEPRSGTALPGTMWPCLRHQILPRLAHCLFMLVCIGIAMSGFESLGVSVQKSLSADGFICAMLCGMCLYHLVLGMQLNPSEDKSPAPL